MKPLLMVRALVLAVWGLGVAGAQAQEYREILPPGPRDDWSDRTEPEVWAPPERVAGRIALNEALVIDEVGLGGRYPLHTDAIEKQIVLGQWRSPATGDVVTLPDGRTRAWRPIEADADGWFQDPALRGGYADFVVLSDSDRVMMLDASGHSLVYVNGIIRAGDPYGIGNMKTPVKLKKGLNELLFRCRRGRLRAALYPPPSAVMLDGGEVTLPDLVQGDSSVYHGSILIVNASEQVLEGTVLLCDPAPSTPPDVARLFSRTITAVPAIPPLSVYKAPFTVRPRVVPKAEGMEARLALARSEEALNDHLTTATISLEFRNPLDTRRETFVSEIDGSVQYYAVLPARPGPGEPRQAALVLTAHGAGVEAIEHVNAYTQKNWAHIVAPTNRRAYGFDWEDWGRLDAIEALDTASRRLNADPRRTYLTGHSMGGHGAWHLGMTYPFRFAAIGPSGGWASFWSYGVSGSASLPQRRGSDMEEIIRRATNPSDTLTSLSLNFRAHGVYILHGRDDENVPVSEAQRMIQLLGGFHREFDYHIQPGVGHWWDIDTEPGASCVDWPPMFDFFARRRSPTQSETRRVTFHTANPGISSRARWAEIEAQTRPLLLSAIDIQCDPWSRRFEGVTRNVARLSLRLDHLPRGETLSVILDGERMENIPWPAEVRQIWLSREAGIWITVPPPDPAHKGPHRYGLFKDAFRNRMVFVYGTLGSVEENAWAFQKARYDQETFYYRGNGAVEVVADWEFDPQADVNRNVILYGNAETNSAWRALLGTAPVQITSEYVRVGVKTVRRPDVGCLFIYPRPGSNTASVGVVGGTGIAGMRMTDRIPYFVSGVAIPDFLALTPLALETPLAGVVGAGYFGLDWSPERGEFVWRNE